MWREVLVSLNMAAFCDIAPCSLVEVERRFRDSYCLHHHGSLMMEAVSTSETSVYFYETAQRYIPEGYRFISAVVRT
jgi:hypothetical protein